MRAKSILIGCSTRIWDAREAYDKGTIELHRFTAAANEAWTYELEPDEIKFVAAQYSSHLDEKSGKPEKTHIKGIMEICASYDDVLVPACEHVMDERKKAWPKVGFEQAARKAYPLIRKLSKDLGRAPTLELVKVELLAKFPVKAKPTGGGGGAKAGTPEKVDALCGLAFELATARTSDTAAKKVGFNNKAELDAFITGVVKLVKKAGFVPAE